LTGEQTWDPDSGARREVELHGEAGERSYWEEHKGNGCKYFRNVATHGYLGRCGANKYKRLFLQFFYY